MQLYYHKTDGGAEYYSTAPTENPGGSKEGALGNAILRTDGNEIEIFTDAIKAQGLRLILTGNERPKAARIKTDPATWTKSAFVVVTMDGETRNRKVYKDRQTGELYILYRRQRYYQDDFN